MKKSILIVVIFVFLFSCKKNNTPPGNNPSGLVTSVAYYSSVDHSLFKDTLIYDANQNLVQLTAVSYDTSGGVASMDTGSYYFTINPTTLLPSVYTLTDFKTGYPGVAIETHNLFYDNQKRIVKDTLLTGQSPPGDSLANYYSYTGNTLICNGYSMSAYDPVNLTTGWGLTNTDSITMNNGNLVRQVEYSQNGSFWDLDYTYAVNSYSAYSNPFYNQKFSSSLGALLRNGNNIDCLSKNLISDGMAKWTTDANGRVVSGLGTDGTITTFTYK